MTRIECPHCKKQMLEPIEIIRLSDAILCANCNCLTRAANGHCLACGSQAVVNLENLLNHQSTKRPLILDFGIAQ